MSQHTPGPWRVQGKYLEGGDYGNGRRLLLAEINSHRLGSADRVPKKDEQDANARLIAKAPEMLALLQEFAGVSGSTLEELHPRVCALLREIERKQ